MLSQHLHLGGGVSTTGRNLGDLSTVGKCPVSGGELPKCQLVSFPLYTAVEIKIRTTMLRIKK